MSFIDYFKALKLEQRQAWIVAIAADVLQIAAFPLFAEAHCLLPTRARSDRRLRDDSAPRMALALLPSAAAKLIPGADLFPTWTAAVWFVTRHKVQPGSKRSCRRDRRQNRGGES